VLSIVLIQVGLIVRTAAVQIIEIEARCTEVRKRVRVVLLLKTAGGIERQVVIDELAEVCVACTNAQILFVVLWVSGVGGSASAVIKPASFTSVG
jgi:hypothetical protein